MITTVTLNPCIDLTVKVPSLETGALNLVSDTRTDVSGKGVNVSVVLRALGQPTFCTGISFDGNGKQLEDHLEHHSICRQFAVAQGNIRTNIKVFDEAAGEMTEINHRGYPVKPVVIDQYMRILREVAARSEIVVFSGRIPMGADEDIYRKSIQALKKLPAKVVVDAEGKPLKEAVRQKPYLIKPNLYELETTFRCKIGSREEAALAARKIIEKGVEVVCVSMGGDGALIVDRDRAYHAKAMDVPVKGLQGAGDSMVAGLCRGIREEAGLATMLRYGVAAASASLLREGTQLCRLQDFEELLPQVEIQRLDLPPLPAKEKAARKPTANTTPNNKKKA